MKSLVVYESWFGNTRKVAEAIADALRAAGDVAVASVADPPPPADDFGLLVLGGPTHVHGLSSSMSRRSAQQQLGLPATETPGLRTYVRDLPPVEHRYAAVFDTRFEKSAFLTGSAAHSLAKQLKRRGYELLVPPESFFVLDTEGPLKDGEVARAAAWAGKIVEQALLPAA